MLDFATRYLTIEVTNSQSFGHVNASRSLRFKSFSLVDITFSLFFMTSKFTIWWHNFVELKETGVRPIAAFLSSLFFYKKQYTQCLDASNLSVIYITFLLTYSISFQISNKKYSRIYSLTRFPSGENRQKQSEGVRFFGTQNTVSKIHSYGLLFRRFCPLGYATFEI